MNEEYKKPILLLLLLVISGKGFTDTPVFDAQLVFKIGYHINSFPDLTPTEAYLTFGLIAKELGKVAKCKVSHFAYNDIIQMRNDFQRGVFNFIILPPLKIVKYFNPNMLRGGFNATANSLPLDTLQLITRKNEGLDSFTDLQEHQLSLLKNEDLSELYLKTLLSRLAKNNDSFFSNIDKQKNSQRVILKLFFKQTDAILVYKSQFLLAVEMNPQIGKNVQVIEQYKGVPKGIGFFHKDVNAKLRKHIILSVLEFQHSVRGQQLLELLKSDEIKHSYVSDLQAVSDLYFDYKRLKNKQ